MLRFSLVRAGSAVVVAFGAVSVVFLIMRLLPGDPAALYAGPLASQSEVRALSAELGLDRPLLTQYLEYMRNILQLDFGRSYRSNTPVIQLVMQRLPATVLLSVAAMAIAVVVSLPMGLLAAMRPFTKRDRLISTGSLVGQVLPGFWIGILLILLFAAEWQLLPSGGFRGPTSLILPAATLSLSLVGMLTHLVRSGLIDTATDPYVLTAKSKGLESRTILVGHRLPNTLIPVITVAGIQFGSLLSGTVVIEVVFAWPGVGRLLVDSMLERDFAVAEVTIMIITLMFIGLNLLVDLAYARLDPRVRISNT